MQLMMHKEGTSWNETLGPGIELVSNEYFPGLDGSSETPILSSPTKKAKKQATNLETESTEETEETETPVTTTNVEEEGSNTGLIIGIVIGVIVLIGVIVAVVVCMRKTKSGAINP
jgi:uncharacterized membrane protein